MGKPSALDTVSSLIATYTSLGRTMRGQKLDACSFQDFRAVIREIGNDAVSTEALAARVGGSLDIDHLAPQIMTEWRSILAEQFFDGCTGLVAPFPCNLNGIRYSLDDIKRGRHIHIVAVDESTRKGAQGDGMFAILPLQIWNAGKFKVSFDRDSIDERIANAEHTRAFLRQVLKHFGNVAAILQ